MSEGIPSRAPAQLYNSLGLEIENSRPYAETGKILCTAHNSQLGASSDPVGIKVFEFLNRHAREQQKQKLLVNGNDFERFLLQRLCAIHFGKITSSHQGSLAHFKIDQDAVEKVMVRGEVEQFAGLYLAPPPAHFQVGKMAFEMTPIHGLAQDEIRGIRVTFGYVSFVFLLKYTITEIPIAFCRPQALLLPTRNGDLHELWLSWDGGAESGVIDYRHFLTPVSSPPSGHPVQISSK